jgi:hypothetical protein
MRAMDQLTRQRNLATLQKAGFRVAAGLPLRRGGRAGLRPACDIASRLIALDALFTWVAYSPENVESERVRHYGKANQVDRWLTKKERAIFALDREEAGEAHRDNIGWRLENIWSLAWALGFAQTPDFGGAMITDEQSDEILLNFLPGLEGDVDDLLRDATMRPEAEVAALEDLFYCAHNAVRSAQLGGNTVPKRFNPISNGGVIHERRHALTWCLSPGVAWDETDLST